MSESKYNEAYKKGIEKGRELSRLEHIFSNCDEAYQQGRTDAIDELKEKYLDADAYNEGLADGRADAIDECITKLLTESITCFSDAISVLEQLKENRE